MHTKLLEAQASVLTIQSDKCRNSVAAEYVMTTDEIKKHNSLTQHSLINESNRQITILKNTVDSYMADDGDEDKLKEQKSIAYY